MAKFTDIIGQEQLKEHLQNAIAMNKVSHAYLINGERSSGKEFAAKVFAAALQCEKGGTGPCGECHSCIQEKSGNQPDIIFVSHDKPNTIGVEDIRTQINNDIGIKPYSSPRKIYIMNEGEKMTVQAQNALLKTLEEPPEYAVILILTTNVDALLPTILSRCVVLNMKPVPDHKVKKYLMEELQIPDYKANICVAFARGNIGKAKMLASSEEFEKVKEEIKEINPENLTVFMESTGTYHLPVERYFRENGFNTLVINSLTTKMILLEKRKQTKRIVTD